MESSFLLPSMMAAAVFALLLCSTHAQNVTSKLQIHIPRSLYKEGGYDHREALFGVPPYGASIQQFIYYADSDLCDRNVDNRGGFPERDTDPDTGRMLPWPSPFILMVDRGRCTFVNKVRNAQHAGAAAVIIADNTCLCGTAGDGCVLDVGQQCESNEPIMADDGSGGDITIPSFLMFKQHADPIKKELRANGAVRIEMSWPLPAPDARVEYELWTRPADQDAREFLRQFGVAAVALGSHAYFTPRMHISDGIKSGCQDSRGQNECYTLCTNHGRYCANDPDGDFDKGISGADVVRESLRRLCAWNYYGKGDGVGASWWGYVREFMNRCDNEDYFNNEDCVKDAMRHAGIDYTTIQSCMSNSGGLVDNGHNTILDEQIAAIESAGVIMIPAVYVNNVPLRGALKFSTVFKAICAGYVSGSLPQICDSCSSCGDPMACVNGDRTSCNGSPVGRGAGGGSPVFTGFMLIVVAGVAAFGVRHFQKNRSDMREQVRGILAEYMPLEGENGDVGSPMELATAGRGAGVAMLPQGQY